ncbi:hypothetical protein [Saccharothrix syringae]|uniref:Uncharacterized protein n=1 Tax=Saccharothrix syringae TaxID=103733 RepID=A0A5Q0GXN6_SACSY|nr:hypothetical protein [Saccharothrix syringae]QFZ18250.1 hypothetical protein EKG83_12845 [Saccharothrix syringae]
MTRRVFLSNAGLWAWAVVAVAVAAAALHVWGITETPETGLFWFLTAADLVVAGTAAAHAVRWPRHAVFEPDALVLAGSRVPYDAITAVRVGSVSAKPFWLAFWLPNSLLVGLVVALRDPAGFTRDVVEVDTARERFRARWRSPGLRRAFLDALHAARPDVEPSHDLDGGHPARDRTPRLGVPGGLLACALSVWAVAAGLLSLQLADRSTYHGPYPTEATSAALRSLTSEFRDYEALPGVPVDLRTQRCDRTNPLLGPSPDVVELHLVLESHDLPEADADAVEARIRQDADMDPDTYLTSVDRVSGVSLHIPASSRLSVWVSTGCVAVEDAERLGGDLRALAAALGAGR